MTKTIYRALDGRGRITIPEEIREQAELKYNSIVGVGYDNGVVGITPAKICDHCIDRTKNSELLGRLDALSPQEQYDALVHLTEKWAKQKNDGRLENGTKISD